MPETLTDAQKVLRNDTGKRIAVALESLASEVTPAGVIAQEYDPTATYAVGDMVIYRSVLYRCTTAITTPEEWTAAHWTETMVSDAYRQAVDQDAIDRNLMALGLTGAAVGDLVRVAGVDANGKPTSWRKAPLCEVKTGENLLINWYFVGGGSQSGGGKLPINQRRQTTWSNPGYTIDRWKLQNGSAELTAAGLTLNGTLVQIRETAIGLPVTCSALLSDGSMITPTYNDTTKTFTLTATGQTIKAVKLELGAEQTLAHQENGVWVLNELPDYNIELTKCKRFYQMFYYNGIYPGIARESNKLWLNIPVPVQMRGTPTIRRKDTNSYYIVNASGLFEIQTATVDSVFNLLNTININMTHSVQGIPPYTAVNILIPTLEADAEIDQEV